MNLLISLRSELLKTKRTASIYLCLIAAGIIPVTFFLEHSMGNLSPETLQNPWPAFFMQGIWVICFGILPMYVILAATLLPQLEYRNNTWKQVLVSPQSKAILFISKFIVIHLYILMLLSTFIILMLSAGGLGQLIRPDVVLFSDKSNWSKFFNTAINTYIAILGISAFQFWLGIRFKNFVAPIGIGFALWMLTLLLLFDFKWEHADKIPYSYPILNVFPVIKTNTTFVHWSSFGYALIFLVLGFLNFKKRTIKA